MGSVAVPGTSLAWLESLSPWPVDGFGTERMRALLERLGNPQRSFEAVHIVGTKGKSTAARRIARTIGGLAYTSPHVSGWHERLDTDPDGFERAVARIRADAEAVGATQFEAVTAAAFADFVARDARAAAIEAGLGGRHDATNTIDARVVLLTNVGLEHTDVLGATREEIAREKLAVAGPDAVVVLGEPEWASLVPGRRVVPGGAREAAEAFLGRAVTAEVEVGLPGRFEVRGEHPLEVWDGAHNAAGADYLAGRARDRDWVLVASVLRDKDVGAMLRTLRRLGTDFVATTSSNPRALAAAELAARARPFFERVETVAEPAEAVARGRQLAGSAGAVLVTGSLYLLSDLSVRLQGVP